MTAHSAAEELGLSIDDTRKAFAALGNLGFIQMTGRHADDGIKNKAPTNDQE